MNTTERIAKFIDSHSPAAPTQINQDGTLTVYATDFFRDGSSKISKEIIQPSISAARDWLGY